MDRLGACAGVHHDAGIRVSRPPPALEAGIYRHAAAGGYPRVEVRGDGMEVRLVERDVQARRCVQYLHRPVGAVLHLERAIG